jgi:hypothetical protein
MSLLPVCMYVELFFIIKEIKGEVLNLYIYLVMRNISNVESKPIAI